MATQSSTENLIKPSLIGIIGPTGSGKTDVSLRLASKIPSEVIAADSRTVYRGLDIGTAKPSLVQRQLVRHHLIDVAGPSRSLNVADFQLRARQAWQQINNCGRWALLVGGSGLYVDSLLWDYQFESQPVNQKQRQHLNQLSVKELQQLISQQGLVRPENWTNKRYLVRTIERGHQLNKTPKLVSGVLVVGLNPPAEKLKDNLSRRWEQMIADGVIGEAEWAWREYSSESEALKSNIYRSLRPYLQGQESLEQARDDFLRRDWQLARRQLTWWRRRAEINWFDNPEDLIEGVLAWVKSRKISASV